MLSLRRRAAIAMTMAMALLVACQTTATPPARKDDVYDIYPGCAFSATPTARPMPYVADSSSQPPRHSRAAPCHMLAPPSAAAPAPAHRKPKVVSATHAAARCRSV